MKISPAVASHLTSLGEALRQQALFEHVRQDNADELSMALSAYDATRAANAPPDKKTIEFTPQLIDLLVSIALSEKSSSCLALLFPRIEKEALLGSNLNRMVEKDRLEAVQMIAAFYPLDESTRARCIEKAAFSGSPKVLGFLLEGLNLDPEWETPYFDSVDRRNGQCLQVLLDTQDNPVMFQRILAQACVMGNQDAIARLAPRSNLAQAMLDVVSSGKLLTGGIQKESALDGACEQFVADVDLAILAPLVLGDPSLQAALPRTFSRLAKQELARPGIAMPPSRPGISPKRL